MLNKHNVLHKSLYTLHKNAQRSQPEPLKQLCNAVVVVVAGADDIPQCPDLGQGVGHHGGHTGPGQHGAVIVAVADGKGGLPGDAEPVGQSQQGGTLVHPCGGDLYIVRGTLYGLDAGKRPETDESGLCNLDAVEEHTEFFHFVGVAAHPFVQIPHNMGTAIVRLSGLGGMALDMTVLKPVPSK